MPEVQNIPEPKVASPEFSVPPKKKSKKVVLILIGLLVLFLVGIGIWLLISSSNKTPSKSSKQATSSGKIVEVKKTRTKAAFEDNSNIFVVDVATKKKLQITKDGNTETRNSNPIFIDEDTFTHLKCASSKCELWKVDLVGTSFTTEQFKKLNSEVNLYNVGSQLKTLVYYEVSEKDKLHLFNLASGLDKVVYEKEGIGRGGSQDDAVYARISPDGAKFLLVDTVGGQNIKISGEAQSPSSTSAYNDTPIIVWDMSGDKIATLVGRATEPVWKSDSKGLIYRVSADGIFEYDISNKTSKKINSEKDWSDLNISPNGKKLSHNKGFVSTESGASNSSVYLYDLESKIDTLIAENLVSPVWVNDEYLITSKLRKCQAEECLSEDFYTFVNKIIIVNVGTKELTEIETEKNPIY